MIEMDWLKRWNLYAPHSVALKDADSGREYTYQDFYHQANRIAWTLRERFHIEPGDRVAVLATNELEYFFLFFGLQRLGAVMVPINFRLTAREVEHIIQDSGAKLLITQESFRPLVAAMAPAGRPKQIFSFDDPSDSLVQLVNSPLLESGQHVQMAPAFEDCCMILYTSGTTGAPKGALITYQMLFWNSINTTLRLNISEGDVTLSFLPFFHTGGWNVLNTPFLHRGAKIVFIPKFDPERVVQLCESEKVTILFGVPTTMEMMRQAPTFPHSDLSTVRYAIVGGEPMPLPLIHAWQEKGVPIRQGYGLTEFGPNVFSLNEEDSVRKIGSIGFPNFYIEARVVDDHGHELAANEIGELVLRGPTCTPGYWRNAKATADTIRDGWLHTGDLVRTDDEGYFYVVGRKKDMYISGGENVYPTEVEQFLRTHPSVCDVAVVGVPDPKWGEVGRAFVVCQTGSPLTEQALLAYCTGRLAKFKTPKYVTFLKDLPKGDSGKILKRKLIEEPLANVSL